MNVHAAISHRKEITYMKAYTIDTENNITVHASRKEARETGLGVFTSEEQLAELVGPDNKRFIEIWNGLTGVTPVTKFANRTVATARIWKAIQTLGEQTTDSVPETPFDEPESESAPPRRRWWNPNPHRSNPASRRKMPLFRQKASPSY